MVARPAASGAAAAVASVPSALLVPLYRQLLRSARRYAAEAAPRRLLLGPELLRLCAAWPAEQRAAALPVLGVASTTTVLPAVAPPARVSSPLSAQLDDWLVRKPHLFAHLLIAEQKRIDAAAASAARAAEGGEVQPAEHSTEVGTPESKPAPRRRKAAAPSSTADASEASLKPAPPAWVSSMKKAGASTRVVSESLLVGLLRRAFRLRLRNSKESSVRLSNAFALNKRLAERSAELRLLPLVSLRSRACVRQGPVRVSLRCLGAFKRAHSSTWFSLEWRVDNVSADRNVVLTQRKIVTLQREASGSGGGPAGAGSMIAGSSSMQLHSIGNVYAVPSPATAVAAAAAAQQAGSGSAGHSYAQGTSHTSLPALCPGGGGSSGAPPRSSPLPSLVSPSAPFGAPPAGLRVESMGVGLAGRPIALPSGSGTGSQRGLLRLDGACGTLSAELHFSDVTTVPHSNFVVTLPTILLDAAAEWNEEGEEGEEDEFDENDDAEPQTPRPDPRSPEAHRATRAMFSSMAQLGTAQQLGQRSDESQPKPTGSSAPEGSPSSSPPEPGSRGS